MTNANPEVIEQVLEEAANYSQDQLSFRFGFFAMEYGLLLEAILEAEETGVVAIDSSGYDTVALDAQEVRLGHAYAVFEERARREIMSLVETEPKNGFTMADVFVNAEKNQLVTGLLAEIKDLLEQQGVAIDSSIGVSVINAFKRFIGEVINEVFITIRDKR